MDRMDKLRKLYPDAMQRAYYTVKLLSEPEGRLEYLKDPDDEFVKNALELMFGPAPVSETILPDAAFFGVLKDGWASASILAKKAKEVKKAKQKVEDQNGKMLDHRPHDQHGPPLQILSNAFANFTEILNSRTPSAEDCRAAAAMVALVSQILEDEREDMQPQMAQLLEDWLGPYVVFVQSKHSQPIVDIAGTLRGIKVLMNELKTDNGGNARIELLRYYGADVASVWESASGAALLDRFCLPRLYVEVNTGLMCVGGMAIIGRDLLSEPLMPALQLYRSNSPQHMLAVARALLAVRESIYMLAAEHEAAIASLGSPRLCQAGCPPLLWQLYPNCRVTEVWGGTIYLITPRTSAGTSSDGDAAESSMAAHIPLHGLLAKFWQPQNELHCGDAVQKAWAAQGVAPQVVGTHKVGAWQATIMEYLGPQDSWAPLTYYAPASGKLRLQARDQLESAGQLPEPATELEWPAVCKAATDALGRGHRALVTLPGCNVQPSSTVHADARLINIMARRKEGGKWEVKYVDFAWSGIHERTRYPVLMSPDVKWPLGAQAQGLLRQKHDQELLTDELEKGLGREVLADVHEGEVEGQVNWAGEQMDMV